MLNTGLEYPVNEHYDDFEKDILREQFNEQDYYIHGFKNDFINLFESLKEKDNDREQEQVI